MFAAPVYHQVHHEPFAASETTEKTADFPVVQEQVIVQATPRVVDSLPSVTVVVGSLPPPEEFTVPAYNPVHQEQFSAGETTENIAKIPVVQDQVLVQAIPRFVGAFPPVEELTAYVARRAITSCRGAAVCTSTAARRGGSRRVLPPMVQILDDPVPQMVDYVAEALRLLDRPSRLSQCPQFSCSSCPSRFSSS